MLLFAASSAASEKLTAEACQREIEPHIVNFHVSRFQVKPAFQDPGHLQTKLIMCADSPAAPTELPHPSLVKSYALLYHKKSAAGLSELVAAAEAGQAKAQAVLALLYLRPKFLGASYQALFISQPKMPPKDLDKAIDFARRAADQNDADGHLVLALICREKGDTQNFLLHAREAANAQTDIAQFLLGIALMSKKPPRREIARMV